MNLVKIIGPEKHIIELKVSGNYIIGRFQGTNHNPCLRGEGLDKLIAVNHLSVSRQHLKITFGSQEIVLLTDLNSTYGTQINGQRLNKGASVLIKPGEYQVKLGNAMFKFLYKS